MVSRFNIPFLKLIRLADACFLGSTASYNFTLIYSKISFLAVFLMLGINSTIACSILSKSLT